MKKIFVLLLASFFVFTSCRTEDEQLITSPEEQTLDPNSNVANLVSRTAQNDGSTDNILDNANCFTVVLPVTVFIDGLEIIIDDESDFDTIEDLFDEDDTDIDELDFQYPITILLDDYTEVVINNEDELDAYIDQCEGDNEEDDDIECVDFQYPLTFSVFDQNNELIDTVTINSDIELFLFIEGLDDDDIVNLNFPVTLILSDGNTVVVNDLDELEDTVENAIDDCDEDDDTDYDDDDCEDCTTDELNGFLTDCPFWTIDKLEIDDNDQHDLYDGYHFEFRENGVLFVENDTEAFEGTWSSTGSGEDITVIIDIADLPELSNDWTLHEIEEEGNELKVDLRDGDDRLRFECGDGNDDDDDDDNDDNDDDDNDDNDDDDNDDDGGNLTAVLIDGEWIVALYDEDGDDQTNDYQDFTFDFQENDEVVGSSNSETVNGFWNAFNNGTEMELNFGTHPILEELNDEDWEVVSFTSTRVELRDVSGGNGGVDTLVFEKL